MSHTLTQHAGKLLGCDHYALHCTGMDTSVHQGLLRFLSASWGCLSCPRLIILNLRMTQAQTFQHKQKWQGRHCGTFLNDSVSREQTVPSVLSSRVLVRGERTWYTYTFQKLFFGDQVPEMCSPSPYTVETTQKTLF